MTFNYTRTILPKPAVTVERIVLPLKVPSHVYKQVKLTFREEDWEGLISYHTTRTTPAKYVLTKRHFQISLPITWI